MIVQNDRFDATNSVTICVFTADETEALHFRIAVDPDETNGLHEPSRLMTDKLTTVPRERMGNRIGALDEEDMARLDRAMMVFLGLA